MEQVLITGGSGLVGTRLTKLLLDKGYGVMHLSRSFEKKEDIEVYTWDIEKGVLDEEAITRAEHIIHLAGAGIADERWSAKRKQVILESRVKSAELLIDRLRSTGHKLKSFVSASAVGYYGNRGHQFLHEADVPGKGFLTDICVAWEKSAEPVAALAERLVVLRTGIALSTQGGALIEMAKPVGFHVGAYLGDGNQYYSWIHIDDLCAMYIKAIEDNTMQGIYNAVGPNPQRNIVITKAIAEARDVSVAMVPAPVFALRLALGEMADTVLDSTRVSSSKIEEAGFEFKHPDLPEALKHLYDNGI